MVDCPYCKSKRIISARHDSDWGGGSRIKPVNSTDVYTLEDLDENGDVYGDVYGYGDIDILVCLACEYTWLRHGSFRPTLRG